MVRQKTRAVAASLLFCYLIPLFVVPGAAQTAPAPQQLIDAAHNASDLSQSGPYILSADVAINPDDKKNKKTGHLTISRDHDRARIELEIGGIHETRVFLGGNQYIAPGQIMLFETRLNRFDQSWDPALAQKLSSSIKYTFGAVRRQKIHGVDAWCFDKTHEHSKDKDCFDAVHPVLLFENARDNGVWDFLDFTAFGQQAYPQRVLMTREKMAPIEVSHIAVASATLNDELFAVPEKSIELEVCDGLNPPKAIYTPEPQFPEEARRKGRNALVLLYMLVNKEGKVSIVQALTPDDYGFNENAKLKVKTWRFEPATCGHKPVNTEVAVEVAFNLY